MASIVDGECCGNMSWSCETEARIFGGALMKNFEICENPMRIERPIRG
jgi:hypothetical protein